MTIVLVIAFLLVGALAGILSGLLGIGGGVVFVPLQILIYYIMGVPLEIQMKLAVGTSLAAIIFTSISATIAHAKKGSVYWQMLYKMGLGIVIGAVLGSIIARVIPGKLLEIFFGIAIIGLGLYSFFLHAYYESNEENLPNYFIVNGFGFIVACISSMLGIGGGTLAVPALVHLKVAFRKALGTANAISVMVSLFGVIPLLVQGDRIYEYSIGYVYLPAFIPLAIGSILTAPLGVNLAYTMSRRVLKRIFALMIMIVGLVMIFR